MKQICMAVFILVVMHVTGCATEPDLTPEQGVYLRNALATPLEFTMPKGDADQAWARAQDFIERFSSMKLQKISPNVIRSSGATPLATAFGYYVRKIDLGEDVRFNIECFCNTLAASATDASIQNAHILAYYMKTGKLDPLLVTK